MLHIPYSNALVVLLLVGWLGTCAMAAEDESSVVKKKKTSESLHEILGQHNGKLPLLDEYKRGFWHFLLLSTVSRFSFKFQTCFPPGSTASTPR